MGKLGVNPSGGAPGSGSGSGAGGGSAGGSGSTTTTTTTTTTTSTSESSGQDSAVTKGGPPKEEIQRAINSWKRIFFGRKVDTLVGCEAYCENKKENTLRAVGIIPFLSKFDPWLEYLGHIRDIQSAPRKS